MKYKNVYFINGNAYAGKSTMIKLLSDKYNGILCEENYQDRKLDTLNKKDFPALTYIRNLKVKDIDETIDKFIEYYNNKRLQEKIKELTPFEFRELTLNEYLNFCVFYIHLSISMWKHKIVDRCFLT